GPGNRNYMLGAAIDAIKAADCLIGAERIVEAGLAALGDSLPLEGKVAGRPDEVSKSLPREGKVAEGRMRCFYEISAEKILAVIDENPQFSHFCVLMSGDTGFYSGTKSSFN
ncbi:MAG: hypothetical protein J5622_03960, partial [Firmicutes bacterium]|nr:hypothetical protein [Bacillota bacterium]